jgi:effector-binding domain-containing protein
MELGYDVVETAAQPMIAIRAVTRPAEIDSLVAQILSLLGNHLERLGVSPSGPPFARHYEFREEHVELEAGFPLAEPVEGEGRLAAGELPAGRAVRCWHRGSHDTLARSYDHLASWAMEHGHTPVAPPWEVYWRGPRESDSCASYRTEILWPIR